MLFVRGIFNKKAICKKLLLYDDKRSCRLAVYNVKRKSKSQMINRTIIIFSGLLSLMFW